MVVIRWVLFFSVPCLPPTCCSCLYHYTCYRLALCLYLPAALLLPHFCLLILRDGDHAPVPNARRGERRQQGGLHYGQPPARHPGRPA